MLNTEVEFVIFLALLMTTKLACTTGIMEALIAVFDSLLETREERKRDSPCRQNLKYENFTSSFARLRQNIAPKSVPHMQHDYFSSFNQSNHGFLALSLTLPSTNLRHCLHGRGFICNRIGFDAVTPFVYTEPAEFVIKTGSF